MGNVLVNEASLQDIADAIREKNGSEDTYKPSQMADAVRGIQSGGFDIAPLISGVTFSSDALKDHYDDMYLNLINATNLSAMFDNRPIMFRKITINVSEKNTSLQNTFRGSSVTDPLLHNLKIIVINGTTSGVVSFYRAFVGRFETEEIVGEFDFSNATTVGDIFTTCRELKEVRFAKGTLKLSISLKDSQLLSDDSIQSIIDGLADLTDSDTKTLTFHADVKAKLTEEQISQITSKNWTLA